MERAGFDNTRLQVLGIGGRVHSLVGQLTNSDISLTAESAEKTALALDRSNAYKASRVMDLSFPTTLSLEQPSRYTLVRRLGEGGMGAVYEAIQHGADGFTKRVAIKVIRNSVSQRPEFLQNFVGEAKLVAQLVHANIVQMYQFGRSEVGPFMAMELVHGTDLLQLSHVHDSRQKRIPIPLTVFIVSRVCRGLSYAHSKLDEHQNSLGIVHRDISPQNIMVSRDGDVKITDFGLAKAVNMMLDGEGEVVVGKVQYMSPEQARGGVTDGRSDIFSTGVVLSELLSGVNIFAGGNSEQVIDRILHLEIPDFQKLCPELEEPLSFILKKALARDPDKRYGTASQMLVDLEKYIYSAGYGPTMETLADYMKLYIETPLAAAPRTGSTALVKVF